MATTDRLRLYVFDCGSLVARGAPFVHPSGEVERIDATFGSACWLVAHPAGLLLWDAGMPDAWIDRPKGVPSPSGTFRFHVTRTLASCLAAVGATAADVTHLAFSHLHLDHTGNANAVARAGATVLAQRAELEAAFAERPPAAYDPASYAALRSSRIVPLDGDYDVFGDGTVRMLAAPGHSAGHQVLLVDLAETGPGGSPPGATISPRPAARWSGSRRSLPSAEPAWSSATTRPRWPRCRPGLPSWRRLGSCSTDRPRKQRKPPLLPLRVPEWRGGWNEG